MEQDKRDLITKNKEALSNGLQLDSFLSVLKEKRSTLFPDEWMTTFQNTALTLQQRKDELLESVPKRGPQAFEDFVDGLRNSGQEQLVNILCPDKLVNGASGEPSSLSSLASIQNGSSLASIQNGAASNGSGDQNSALVRTKYYGERKFDESRIYRMESNPRGLALIINNVTFTADSKLTNRDGAENDHIKMKNLLSYLGFHVLDPLLDRTREQMYQALRDFPKDDRHEDLDASVVVLMSHGENNGCCGIEGFSLNLQQIYNMYSTANAPLLINKPKVFLLNLCRGDKTQQGVSIDSYKPKPAMTDSLIQPKTETSMINTSDILIFYSTLPDHVSLRDPYIGAWFVDCLVRVFNRFAHIDDFHTMCQEVKRELACYVAAEGERQTGETSQQGFVRTLYFNPPSVTVPQNTTT